MPSNLSFRDSRPPGPLPDPDSPEGLHSFLRAAFLGPAWDQLQAHLKAHREAVRDRLERSNNPNEILQLQGYIRALRWMLDGMALPGTLSNRPPLGEVNDYMPRPITVGDLKRG